MTPDMTRKIYSSSINASHLKFSMWEARGIFESVPLKLNMIVKILVKTRKWVTGPELYLLTGSGTPHLLSTKKRIQTDLFLGTL